MKLWTVQPLSSLEEIHDTGVFRCDESKSYNLTKTNTLKPQYAWLIQKMEQRIGKPPKGVTYPVWAWHTWEYKRRAPDPGSAAFLERTEDKILYTLEVPDSDVVLTDFDAWQIVLNNMYLTNETDEHVLEKLLDEIGELTDEQYEKGLRSSWDTVFDVTPIHTDTLTRGKYIQATFWEIKKEYIQTYEVLKKSRQ